MFIINVGRSVPVDNVPIYKRNTKDGDWCGYRVFKKAWLSELCFASCDWDIGHQLVRHDEYPLYFSSQRYLTQRTVSISSCLMSYRFLHAFSRTGGVLDNFCPSELVSWKIRSLNCIFIHHEIYKDTPLCCVFIICSCALLSYIQIYHPGCIFSKSGSREIGCYNDFIAMK